MGKKCRTAGALLILATLFLLIWEIAFVETPVWLFTSVVSILFVTSTSLLFIFGKYVDETERHLKSLEQRIKLLEADDKKMIVTEEDVVTANILNKTVDVLDIRKGLLYLDNYMTLLSNVNESHLSDNSLVITILGRPFLFSFNESQKDDVIKLRDLLNQVTKK